MVIVVVVIVAIPMVTFKVRFKLSIRNRRANLSVWHKTARVRRVCVSTRAWRLVVSCRQQQPVDGSAVNGATTIRALESSERQAKAGNEARSAAAS